MTIQYNVPGSKRKELVKTIATWLGEDIKYCGAPTFAYEIDYFTVDREGNLLFNDMADSEVIERLLEHLHDESFDFVSSRYDVEEPDVEIEEPLEDCPPAYGVPEPKQTEPAAEDLSLTVTMPRDFFTDSQLDNLEKLIAAKAPLLKEALGVTALPVSITDETVSFPWFKDDIDAEHCAAYTSLITALCRMAKEAKRVNAKEKETTNAKYEFRCFLLRLGFIGDEFKMNRKILLEKLSGSSAFKSGKAKEAAVCGE